MEVFFQVKAREKAQQLFLSLDKDENGIITEEEFFNGCLKDNSLLVSIN